MQFSNEPMPTMIPSNDAKNGKSGRGGNKKKPLIIAAAVAAVAIIVAVIYLVYPRGSNTTGGNNQEQAVAISEKVANVSVDANGYIPSSITVKKGQPVTFTNGVSVPHRVTADQTQIEGFNTDDPLNQGDTYTYIFTQVGTYHYYDPDDPKTYTGTVEVQ
jgi:plastocyanin